MHGLDTGITELQTDFPERVDAGFIDVQHTNAGRKIHIYGKSDGYRIPSVPGARLKTGEVFRDLYPNTEVTTDMDPPISSKERR
jgi:hypothetical protein